MWRHWHTLVDENRGWKHKEQIWILGNNKPSISILCNSNWTSIMTSTWYHGIMASTNRSMFIPKWNDIIFKNHNPIIKQKGLLNMQTGCKWLHKRFDHYNIYIKIPTNIPSQFYDWMSFTLGDLSLLSSSYQIPSIPTIVNFRWGPSILIFQCFKIRISISWIWMQ